MDNDRTIIKNVTLYDISLACHGEAEDEVASCIYDLRSYWTINFWAKISEEVIASCRSINRVKLSRLFGLEGVWRKLLISIMNTSCSMWARISPYSSRLIQSPTMITSNYMMLFLSPWDCLSVREVRSLSLRPLRQMVRMPKWVTWISCLVGLLGPKMLHYSLNLRKI